MPTIYGDDRDSWRGRRSQSPGHRNKVIRRDATGMPHVVLSLRSDSE